MTTFQPRYNFNRATHFKVNIDNRFIYTDENDTFKSMYNSIFAYEIYKSTKWY